MYCVNKFKSNDHDIQISTEFFFLFKQKTAYEIRPCDWSSDVCSSDLFGGELADHLVRRGRAVVEEGGFEEIGRASCRERVYGLVYISVGGGSLKKKKEGVERDSDDGEEQRQHDRQHLVA